MLERAQEHGVTLRLKDSRLFRGRLVGLDEHMNIVLDDAEETAESGSRRLGRVILRGSNVIAVYAPEGRAARAP